MASRAGGGVYLRDDGQAMPADLLKETSEAYFGFVGKNCPKARIMNDDDGDDDERATFAAVGDVLEGLLENWLKTNKVGTIEKPLSENGM